MSKNIITENDLRGVYLQHFSKLTQRSRFVEDIKHHEKMHAEFDEAMNAIKAEAWDEGHWEGWQNATESLTTDMFGGPTLNPYREERE